MPRKILILLFSVGICGCARLFGWDIHAPGLLSEGFYQHVAVEKAAVALYLMPGTEAYVARDRGSRWADPQTFYIGEAAAPILIEAFQAAFERFAFVEEEPTAAVLQRHGFDYLVAVRIGGFRNRVTLKSQRVILELEAEVYNKDLMRVAHFKSRGMSEAFRVFAKKGGPEVNLNAAIENAVVSMIYFLQENLRNRVWENS